MRIAVGLFVSLTIVGCGSAPLTTGAPAPSASRDAAIEEGRNAGAQRLYLETNHVLTPAIRLYESMGFKHIPQNRIVPSPYARADVYMELIFGE